MMKLFAAVVLVTLALPPCLHAQVKAAPTETAEDHSLDKQAIDRIVADNDDAWNRRDAKGLVAHVTDDTDHIGVGGHWTTGKAALEKHLSQVFSTTQPTQTASIERLRFLSPDIAVAQIRREYRNAKKSWYAISTSVFQKKKGEWLVAAFQNTLVQPDK